ncbi:MAG: TetR/AcrR family transcriptional regulator [Rhodococcus sp. (in: high G+C Gram-positive bacteria)]
MNNEVVSTRRRRRRAETEFEIKERAWAAMRESGPAALSLRNVARQMGMAPSALYRYYPSRTELLEALVVDAFESLGNEVTDVYECSADHGLDAFEAFVAVAHSYRTWARAHRAEYALIFSTALPDYNGTPKTLTAAFGSFAILQRVTADAVRTGLMDLDRIDLLLSEQLRKDLQHMAIEQDVPAASLAASWWCYAMMHGAISLDLNNHLPPPAQNSSAFFESAVRAMLTQIAADPAGPAGSGSSDT